MFRMIAKNHGGGCAMLARQIDDKTIELLGTAFICHDKGYLLTAAHTFSLKDKLGFVPPAPVDQFNSSQLNNFSFLPVSVAQFDAANDVALLKIATAVAVAVPPNIFGSDDLAPVGASVCYLGFPHAHNGQHALKVSGTILGSKVLAPNGTKQLVLDSMAEAGNSGGPLLDLASNRIIGVISRRFSPAGNGASIRIGNHALGTESMISYATAISHALALLTAEGLHV
ncbi:S1 family peptidase [Pandoraea terrigena]|uniref:Peptidase n=1 Tax=Pandoraea terrigena TaxID=2508292 RepID=A0A5E4TR58_9BURK|nr:serine protease [Pandoraea terrigena]VVD89633.1 peptidase [Pandoraea terrigena]